MGASERVCGWSDRGRVAIEFGLDAERKPRFAMSNEQKLQAQNDAGTPSDRAQMARCREAGGRSHIRGENGILPEKHSSGHRQTVAEENRKMTNETKTMKKQSVNSTEIKTRSPGKDKILDMADAGCDVVDRRGAMVSSGHRIENSATGWTMSDGFSFAFRQVEKIEDGMIFLK